ncbi:MAG: magnesium transporter CorA family protein [Parcubacteria group bacterium]
MLKLLRAGATSLDTVKAGPKWQLPQDAIWLDLVNPTREEEVCLEKALKLQLPTREEMAEIEQSSRLYQENGATFMTASILTHAQTDYPLLAPVTFVLAEHRLITIRYAEPSAFKAFLAQIERTPGTPATGGELFLGLLDAVVDRIADILEGVANDVEATSQDIFRRPRRQGGFEPVIFQLGRSQLVDAKARASLASLARLISFAALANQLDSVADLREHLRSLQHDIQSLTDHAGYVSGNITFLLDAALGLINIEQNTVGKVFSVVSVLFLPAMLIASVYGMNFHHMPELGWIHGYPMALALMAASMLAGFGWLKWKGWL